jgi:cyclin H
MASEDARYRQSTQYRLWSFSPAQLAATREKTNALARANISETLLSKQQSSSSSSSNGNGNPNNAASAVAASAPASGANTPDAAAAQALPDFLTPAEELQLLNWYTIQLIQACNFLELRTDFRATAAVFLRRFYVTNSIMTYPPTEMLKTCLFFGCKAEGYYASASK